MGGYGSPADTELTAMVDQFEGANEAPPEDTPEEGAPSRRRCRAGDSVNRDQRTSGGDAVRTPTPPS